MNSDGKILIARLSFVGVLLPLLLSMGACGGSSSQSALVAQSEQNVAYPGTGGVTLAGTLLVPAHAPGARVPGVVIIAGSGAVDRNGNSPQANFTSDLYHQIADQLAQQGIASLRYDKRGVGGSTPPPLSQNPQQPTPAEIAAVQNFAAWTNYVDDAVATLRYLQQQPVIDPAHTALVGHSEGGYIIDQIVSTTQDLAHSPAAIVLVSAAGRTYDAVLRQQIASALKQLQAGDAVTAFVLNQYDALVAGVKQNGQIAPDAIAALKGNSQVPAAILTLLGSIFSVYNAKFLQGAFQVNPVTMLPRYQGPVLILQGASDSQVSATADTPLLDQALRTRQPDDHQTTIVPGASHELKAVQGAASGAGVSGPIVPQAASTLRSWLAQKLGG